MNVKVHVTTSDKQDYIGQISKTITKVLHPFASGSGFDELNQSIPTSSKYYYLFQILPEISRLDELASYLKSINNIDYIYEDKKTIELVNQLKDNPDEIIDTLKANTLAKTRL